MKITEFLKENTLYLDGGMGTLLQGMGLAPGELPERWNIKNPEKIKSIHRAYFDAGCNVVNTNTFGANSLKLSKEELEEIIRSAVSIARSAAEECTLDGERWVALDIGPSGKMLKPYGELEFEEAVRVFGEVAALGEKYGADLIFIETMSDSYETKAALLGAKENSTLPVFVSNAYGIDGKLMTGADPLAMIAMLEGMGADAIGANCSVGPEALAPVMEKYLKYSSVPIILKPNAGLPKSENGRTVYDISPEEFARQLAPLVTAGVRAVGGCCGTTPEYIKALVDTTRSIAPVPVTEKSFSAVSSYTHAVELGKSPILIGERINPTGKKRFKEALRASDLSYIVGEGIKQEEAGVSVLDVNVGLPEIDEKQMLTRVVRELQAVIDLPLQIDTSSTSAMEAALRIYNGKAMINSVSGKAESMREVFPLVKKYGGLVVALTLDEDGIPKSAEDRLKIAEKILSEANKYGIKKKDIIFDPLAMAVSADSRAAAETLKAVSLIREKLCALTSVGVSNVSFGLPMRDAINSSFFTLALGRGLSAAIMNPHSDEMMRAYYCYKALVGQDESFREYIEYTARAPMLKVAESVQNATRTEDNEQFSSELVRAIVKGMCAPTRELAEKLIKFKAPLDIINEDIVPALDKVGEGFEKKTIYLPGLLMSAEAAASAFEVIKAHSTTESAEKCTVVIATVEGDIHDIGKNIVKLLLENYGFKVIDLGRDVKGELIAEAVVKHSAALVGLSALMTTTVPAMEEAIRLIRERAPECKIMVGGAVLTLEYAEKIGADKYGKDAMEAVRYALDVDKSINQ
ncbi:MAG: homocysteine S-methyltransferase family protein [Clostridia bacterium]|nr:homocysteine S-methyltransferase family protein [Clostridia bacterium]